MAAIGKIISKGNGSTNQSVYKTAQYERLTQDPSDDEEDDDNTVYTQEGIKANGVHPANSEGSNGKTPAQEAIEMGLIQTATVSKKKPASDVQVKVMKRRLQSRTRLWGMAFIFLLVIAVVLLVFMLPVLSNRNKTMHYKQGMEWVKEIEDYGTQSCIRLVDVDQDGRQDIIMALAIGLDMEMGEMTRSIAKDFCSDQGLTYPCIGLIMALRGSDGSEMWRTPVHGPIFELTCGGIDVNSDGVDDCLAAGRLGTLLAFDARNGTVLWNGDRNALEDTWNTYAPLLVPDFTQDGIPELVVAHGGDPNFLPQGGFTSPSSRPNFSSVSIAEGLKFPGDDRYFKQETDRYPGRLILVNGATGRLIGRPLSMPDGLETYMSPVLHTRADGSQYIFFGHGGETVSGSLLTISLPDFYRYAMKLNQSSPIPNTRGAYAPWDHLLKMGQNILEVYRGHGKGVMVPPVCIDVNADGVGDIIMSAFDGTFTAYDGESMQQLWTKSFGKQESYSSPAPGFFNDDNIPDFMLHWNAGTWPDYNQSQTAIVDGSSGALLWSLNSSSMETTSDLVAMTTAPNQDAFVFRVVGRYRPLILRKKRLARQRPYPRYPPLKDPYAYSRPRPRLPPSPPVYGGAAADWEYSGLAAVSGSRIAMLSIADSADAPDTADAGEEDWEDEFYKQMPMYNGGRGGMMRGAAMGPGGMSESTQFFGGGSLDDGQEEEDMMKWMENHPNAEDVDPVDEFYLPPVTCKSDLNQHSVEVLLMDRSTAFSPLRLLEDRPKLYKYKITQADVDNMHPVRPRKQRHAPLIPVPQKRTHVDVGTELCAPMLWTEFSTGALGDLDGDGTLDYVSVSSAAAVVTDSNGVFIRNKYMIKLTVTHLASMAASSFKSHQIASLKPFVAESLHPEDSKVKLWDLSFDEVDNQFWSGYMGSRGDSTYTRGDKPKN
ncbi:hypothetical protein CAPTEDRAFT_188461 [Capitella teleta]|uniref:FAM234A/B beta-propeller domain-containing protein n=1 Tax=Capitella teleta TaxID=283909 RepID=R7T6B3_CAPTE|nr:hypothetical protein CAPTEDRAFT_188461 [Capitella teleta]|eukprot:ELT88975.1 hypothetical protein CAPTEDRAFT_188461 [Capitella teleta]